MSEPLLEYLGSVRAYFWAPAGKAGAQLVSSFLTLRHALRTLILSGNESTESRDAQPQAAQQRSQLVNDSALEQSCKEFLATAWAQLELEVWQEANQLGAIMLPLGSAGRDQSSTQQVLSACLVAMQHVREHSHKWLALAQAPQHLLGHVSGDDVQELAPDALTRLHSALRLLLEAWVEALAQVSELLSATLVSAVTEQLPAHVARTSLRTLWLTALRLYFEQHRQLHHWSHTCQFPFMGPGKRPLNVSVSALGAVMSLLKPSQSVTASSRHQHHNSASSGLLVASGSDGIGASAGLRSHPSVSSPSWAALSKAGMTQLAGGALPSVPSPPPPPPSQPGPLLPPASPSGSASPPALVPTAGPVAEGAQQLPLQPDHITSGAYTASKLAQGFGSMEIRPQGTPDAGGPGPLMGGDGTASLSALPSAAPRGLMHGTSVRTAELAAEKAAIEARLLATGQMLAVAPNAAARHAGAASQVAALMASAAGSSEPVHLDGGGSMERSAVLAAGRAITGAAVPGGSGALNTPVGNLGVGPSPRTLLTYYVQAQAAFLAARVADIIDRLGEEGEEFVSLTQANKLLLDKCHLQVLDLISTFSAPLPPLKGVSGSSSSTAPGAQTGSRSQQGQPLSTGDAGGGEVLLAGPAAVPALVMRHRTARQEELVCGLPTERLPRMALNPTQIALMTAELEPARRAAAPSHVHSLMRSVPSTTSAALTPLPQDAAAAKVLGIQQQGPSAQGQSAAAPAAPSHHSSQDVAFYVPKVLNTSGLYETIAICSSQENAGTTGSTGASSSVLGPGSSTGVGGVAQNSGRSAVAAGEPGASQQPALAGGAGHRHYQASGISRGSAIWLSTGLYLHQLQSLMASAHYVAHAALFPPSLLAQKHAHGVGPSRAVSRSSSKRRSSASLAIPEGALDQAPHAGPSSLPGTNAHSAPAGTPPASQVAGGSSGKLSQHRGSNGSGGAYYSYAEVEHQLPALVMHELPVSSLMLALTSPAMLRRTIAALHEEGGLLRTLSAAAAAAGGPGAPPDKETPLEYIADTLSEMAAVLAPPRVPRVSLRSQAVSQSGHPAAPGDTSRGNDGASAVAAAQKLKVAAQVEEELAALCCHPAEPPPLTSTVWPLIINDASDRNTSTMLAPMRDIFQALHVASLLAQHAINSASVTPHLYPGGASMKDVCAAHAGGVFAATALSVLLQQAQLLAHTEWYDHTEPLTRSSSLHRVLSRQVTSLVQSRGSTAGRTAAAGVAAAAAVALEAVRTGRVLAQGQSGVMVLNQDDTVTVIPNEIIVQAFAAAGGGGSGCTIGGSGALTLGALGGKSSGRPPSSAAAAAALTAAGSLINRGGAVTMNSRSSRASRTAAAAAAAIAAVQAEQEASALGRAGASRPQSAQGVGAQSGPDYHHPGLGAEHSTSGGGSEGGGNTSGGTASTSSRLRALLPAGGTSGGSAGNDLKHSGRTRGGIMSWGRGSRRVHPVSSSMVPSLRTSHGGSTAVQGDPSSGSTAGTTGAGGAQSNGQVNAAATGAGKGVTFHTKVAPPGPAAAVINIPNGRATGDTVNDGVTTSRGNGTTQQQQQQGWALSALSGPSPAASNRPAAAAYGARATVLAGPGYEDLIDRALASGATAEDGMGGGAAGALLPGGASPVCGLVTSVPLSHNQLRIMEGLHAQQMHVRAVVAVTSDLLVQEMTSVVTQLLGASSLSRQQGRGSSSGALSPDAQWPPRAPPTRPSRGMSSAVSALLRPLLRALTPLHEASACHLLASAVSLLLHQYQEAVAATPPAAAAKRAVAAATAALVQQHGGGGGRQRAGRGRTPGGPVPPLSTTTIQPPRKAGPGSAAHMLAMQVRLDLELVVVELRDHVGRVVSGGERRHSGAAFSGAASSEVGAHPEEVIETVALQIQRVEAAAASWERLLLLWGSDE